MPDINYYKVGGSLEYQHPTYVVRQADAQLYQGLIISCPVEYLHASVETRQRAGGRRQKGRKKVAKHKGIMIVWSDMISMGNFVMFSNPDKQIAWETMLQQIIMDLSRIHQRILEVCSPSLA